MSVLAIEGISKNFGGVEVLKNVSLRAESGRVTAIIGPNGAGKSTLANIISGLIRAESGTIQLDDVDITRLKAYKRARLGIGRTFQNLQLFAGLTVRENVVLGGYRNGIDARSADGASNVDRAIQDMGLVNLQNRRVEQLGFGEAKLVEPARLVAMAPSVLVMDEPAAGLGAVGVRTLGPWVTERAKEGVIVVFIEHNMRLVMEIADYIYVLDHGEMIAEGTPREVRTNPVVLEAYLGHDRPEGEDA